LGTFFLHLLGMDEHFQEESPVKHGRPSRFSIWVGTLKHMKLSQLLEGIQLSVNFQFFLLFVGFTIWLFVIYTIRQQESLEAQVFDNYMGRRASPSKMIDQQLVSHMRGAIPLQTTRNASSLFLANSAPKNNTPTPPAPPQQSILSSPACASKTANDGLYTSSTSPGAAEASPSETAADPRFGKPDNRFHSAQITFSNTNTATPLFPATSLNTIATAMDPSQTLDQPSSPTNKAVTSVSMGLVRSATISRTNNDGRLRVFVDR